MKEQNSLFTLHTIYTMLRNIDVEFIKILFILWCAFVKKNVIAASVRDDSPLPSREFHHPLQKM